MMYRSEQTLERNRNVIVPDAFLIHDGNCEEIMRYMDGAAFAAPEKTIVIFDKDAPCSSIESAEMQKRMIAFSKANGLTFLQSPGSGYSVLKDMPEIHTAAAAGIHVGTVSAYGMVGYRLTVQEFVKALREGSFSIDDTERFVVSLSGRLSEDADPKSASFLLGAELRKAGIEGKHVVLQHQTGLSDWELAQICAAVTESGARCVSCAEDKLRPDLQFSLSDVEAVVLCPSSMERVVPVSELEGMHVNACFIGGCTDGNIHVLRKVASILRGRTVARHVRLCICPDTVNTYSQAITEGLIQDFVRSGALMLAPSCGSCRRNTVGGIADGEKMLTTGHYNYSGCCGSEKGEVYIVPAGIIAKSAVSGAVTV